MLLTVPNQSFAMSLAINVVSVLLACLAISGAVPAPFPRDKIVVYNYTGDVAASTSESTPYASRFALKANLWVKHDASDPSLKNAYYVVLSHVKSLIYNGKTADYYSFLESLYFNKLYELNDAIQEPFLIVYDDDGKLQGVKIPANESGWSRNMKMAIASMFQLDWPNIKVDQPIKPHTFISKENTIHGNCSVTYDVHPNHQIQQNDNEFVVNKFFSPTKCSGYPVHIFDHVDSERCEAKKEESLNIASKRYIEIEKKENDIFIKKLIAHGSYEYLPWNARSEPHYIITNATFTLHDAIPFESITLPPMSYFGILMTRDLTYPKPRGHYALDAAVDVTQGSFHVKYEVLELELKTMLTAAANYLDEDHLNVNKTDRFAEMNSRMQGEVINRILKTMSYMAIASFRRVFTYCQRSTTMEDITMKNIFIEMIPQVGTTASSLFALEIIREHKIDNDTAVVMLAKLPLNVRVPSHELLIKMSDLAELDKATHVEVRKAGILSFASLVGRTFKDNSISEGARYPLQEYLQNTFEHINTEQDYRMKIVYLMALKNVQLPKICELLAPIIRGDLKISKNFVHFRLLAIWAIDKAIESNYVYALDLLWPVMADQSLPIKLRTAAYEILIHQAMTNTDIQRIHSFMMDESNEHLYNYHYTTIQGIANSVDPCKLSLRENVRKIIRFTRIRDTVPYPLSSAYSFDYEDEKYNHAEKLRTGMVVNEVTGVPEVLQFEHIVTDARKPVSNVALRVHIEGFDKILNLLMAGEKLPQNRYQVLKILRKAAKGMPTLKDYHIDLILIHKGRAVFVFHYDEELWNKFWEEVFNAIIEAIMEAIMRSLSGRSAHPIKPPIYRRDRNIQFIAYDNLYEEQITSDMGLPIILETRIPVLASVRFNYSKPMERMNTDIEFDGRIWRRGDYSMTIYNPLASTWHAVKRSTVTDINIPIYANVAYHKDLQRATISFPEISNSKTSVGGFIIHAKDSVSITRISDRGAIESCVGCHPHEDVTLGTSEKKSYSAIIDSEDTGLRYTMAALDCEDSVTSTSLIAEWYRAFGSEHKNDWNDWIVRAVMATRQQIKNMIISPQVRSCGSLLRIEPSIDHAISRIDLSKSATEIRPDLQKFNVTFSADIIAVSTKKSSLTWDLNVYGNLTEARVKEAGFTLTRKPVGEKHFKMRGTARVDYATNPKKGFGTDLPEAAISLAIAFGHSENDLILMHNGFILTIVGKRSNEQTKEIADSACSKDIANPLYANPMNNIPKTLNCLNQFIENTTLMKYEFEFENKTLPNCMGILSRYVEELFRLHLQPNLRFTDVLSKKDLIEITVHKQTVDIAVKTPMQSYDLVDVDFEKSRFTGFGKIAVPVWYFPLLNTQLTLSDLARYINNDLRICSVYPRTVLTADGQSVPFDMSEKWTLISGDHTNNHYAVIGKMIGKNMAVKVYLSESEVEIVPREDNSFRVIVDGKEVHVLSTEEVYSPDVPNIWNLQVTKVTDHIVVRTRRKQLLVVYGINHVALAIDGKLQGKVSGLCGPLDGTYSTKIPPHYAQQDYDIIDVRFG